jgi:RNA polymerase sigma factor (sigma-70 family)
MAATATKASDRLAAQEAGFARAAANGNGGAFAELYERYEQRAFNLAFRIAGTETDAADAVQEAFLRTMQRLPRLADDELDYGSQLFAATHNVCHELMDRRQRRRLTDRAPESNGSAGSAGTGREANHDGSTLPGQDELREANMRLPERQREALALRELEDLAYGEIATIMETNPEMVAQLLSRARINLCDELHGTVLASIGAPSPECERALPLLAMREDGQLEAGSRDAAWLDKHLAGCQRCRLGIKAMQDASSSYRAWVPIAAAPWLFRETMANAAALAGTDWSGEILETGAARTPAESLPGTPPAYRPSSGGSRRPRRRLVLASGFAVLLLLGGITVALARNDPPSIPARPTAGAAGSRAGKPSAETPAKKRARRRAARSHAKTQTVAARSAVGTTSPAANLLPGPEAAPPDTRSTPSGPASSPSRPGGNAAVQAGQPTSTPKSSAKPRPSPTPTTAAQPATVTAPTSTESPPAEESPRERHRQHEPPGKPPDRPPR